MGLPQTLEPLSAAAYLQWEAEQVEKHEFYHGEVFAMGGASRHHVTVSGNVFSAIDALLEGTPCRAYMADMKLQADENAAYFYPDVLLTCDPSDHKAEQFMRAPTVLVEVLSPSTAAYDRGEKFATYRRIASLREYVLIDPDLKRIELFRRAEHGIWELHDIAEGQPLRLASIEVEVSWDRVFRNVD